MDLRAYYRTIREIEAGIPGECAVIVSRATPDGGREGVLTEAPRTVAARLIAEGAATLASIEQAAAFRERMQALCAEEAARQAAARIQVNIISEADARLLAGTERPSDRKRR